MPTKTYEVRTSRGTTIYSNGNFDMAEAKFREAEKRIGTRLRLVCVTHLEEDITPCEV